MADVDVKETAEPAEPAAAPEPSEMSHGGGADMIATAATVAVVGLAAAVFEAALLPGMVLGVAAMLAPKALPKAGAALNPLFRSTVRGAYRFGKKTREAAAEMQEQVHDLIAEVKAESRGTSTPPKT
jgi:hypothetical protein